MQARSSINFLLETILASTVIVSLLLALFSAFEPGVVFGVDDTFTVKQTITGEIAFETTATDVVMTPNIAGLTGGTSNGSTTVAVRTNDPDGYTLTIAFDDSVAMQYDLGVGEIPNYGAGTPTYNFSVGAGDAGFAFTASSSDVVSALRNTGAACGSGSISLDHCWVMPADATTDYTLVDRNSATPAGGHPTTIAFRVGVGANPDPVLQIGTYTATATLTALEK